MLAAQHLLMGHSRPLMARTSPIPRLMGRARTFINPQRGGRPSTMSHRLMSLLGRDIQPSSTTLLLRNPPCHHTPGGHNIQLSPPPSLMGSPRQDRRRPTQPSTEPRGLPGGHLRAKAYPPLRHPCLHLRSSCLRCKSWRVC
jgi:hypothetical protein